MHTFLVCSKFSCALSASLLCAVFLFLFSGVFSSASTQPFKHKREEKPCNQTEAMKEHWLPLVLVCVCVMSVNKMLDFATV